jgi:hypothetical protein
MTETIHYPRVARTIADQTGLDYNTEALPLVEYLTRTPEATLSTPSFVLSTFGDGDGDSRAYFRYAGELRIVDTSTPCPECGGSSQVTSGHPDACHHIINAADDDATPIANPAAHGRW